MRLTLVHAILGTVGLALSALIFRSLVWAGEPDAKSKSTSALVGLPTVDRPASRAMKANDNLRELYKRLSSRQSKPNLSAADISTLAKNLRELDDLDSAIREISLVVDPFSIRKEACRLRAIAWLHGWVAFGEIAMLASQQGDDSVRQELFGPGLKSPLGLLLRVYAQISRDDNTQSEPLRFHLKDGAHFRSLLGYRRSWKDAKPKAFEHDYFIPSVADIVGRWTDDPRINEKGLLSLWGLINSQLDTWHDLGVDPASIPHSLRGNGSQPSAKLQLGMLIEWLEWLVNNTDLMAFDFNNKDGKDSKSSTETISHGLRLAVRSKKLVRFLRFRARVSEEMHLDSLAKALADQRLTIELPPTDRQALDDLLEAARPISSDGAQKSEGLADAAIWLRYALLLSYRGQRSLIAETEAVNGSMAHTWKALDVGQPLAFSRTNSDVKGGGGFLRWDRVPDEGHSSAILADLTTAALAHFELEQKARRLEKDRFMASSAELAQKYSSVLKEVVEPADAIMKKRLRPYFLGASLAEPLVLTRVKDGPGKRFRMSGTVKERARWTEDLTVLASESNRSLQRFKLIEDVFSSSDSQSSALALQALGGISGLTDGNIHLLPQKPFNQYHADLERLINRLEKEANVADVEKELREAFHDRAMRLQIAETELAAARLGQQVANKAKQVSNLLLKAAELEAEIEELEVQIAKLESQAWDNKQHAAGVKLAYATRMRDLAAAKVEALFQASEQAEKLAEETSKQLTELGESFKRAATDIRDERRRARMFSILRSVVTVVGAALAPFTGGASLTVASLATSALTIAERIDKTDWHNFGEAVAAVGDIAQQAYGGVTLAVDKFGGPAAKKWLKEAQDYARKAGDKVKPVLEIGSKAETVWKKIKALERDGDVFRFASGIANGMPLSFEQGALKIDFGKKKIEFRDEKLQRALQGVFDAGAHFVNNAEARAQGLFKLPELPDSDLKEKLGQATDYVIKVLPADIRERLKLPGDEVVVKMKTAIENLKKEIADDNLSADARRALAQALAGGLLFAKEGKTVIALERPLEEEAQRFRERIKSFQKKVATAAIQTAIDNLQKIQNELTEQGQKLIDKKNDESLDQLAGTTIPNAIKDAKAEVEKVKAEIQAAKGELEDKQDDLKIANFEAEAANLFAQAAKLRVDQADGRARRARYGLEAAKLTVEASEIKDELEKLRARASQQSLKLAEIELRRTYETCLLRGINPLDPEGSNGKTLQKTPGTSFKAILIGADEDSLMHRPLVERMAGNVVGMLRWARLLRLANDDELARIYVSVLDAFAKPTRAYLKNATNPEQHAAGQLMAIGARLKEEFDAKAAKRLRIEIAKATNVTAKEILWRDQMSAAELDLITWNLDPRKRKTLKDGFIGAVRMRVRLKDGPRLSRDIGREHVPPALEGRFDLYLDAEEGFIVATVKGEATIDNLHTALLFPPTGIRFARTFDIGAKTTKEFLQPVFSETQEKEARERFQTKLGVPRDLQLESGFGDWTFLIFDSSAENERAVMDRILQLRDQGSGLRIHIRILGIKIESE